MIPGELTVDNSFTVDVSDDFTGTIAIGQAELHGHFGLTGSLGGTKRYGAVSTKANSQVVLPNMPGRRYGRSMSCVLERRTTDYGCRVHNPAAGQPCSHSTGAAVRRA